MKRFILLSAILFGFSIVLKAQTWQYQEYTNTVEKKTTLKYDTKLKSASAEEELINDDAYNYIGVRYLTYIENAAVGIGKQLSESSEYMLGVNGTIGASRIEVKASDWADDVFEDNYNLLSIEEVANFIENNNHLPGVPSEKEVMENNIDLGAMDATLLRKIEELTLYIIEQEKRIEALEAKLSSK
jgi:hypothetical protein